MAIFSVRLTTALYRRAFCQVRVSPFNGFSTWRRSSPKLLFDNSALAASAARTEALQDREYASECAGGASGPAARSKIRPPQELQPRARAGSSDEKPVSAHVLAGAIVNPVKNAGCECGGGRGRISGERRTQDALKLAVISLVRPRPHLWCATDTRRRRPPASPR